MAETALKVLHTIPGRLRLEVPLLEEKAGLGSALQERVQVLDGVESVRINRLAHSIAIEYDQTTLSAADLQQHLADLIQSLHGFVSETQSEGKSEAEAEAAVPQQPLPGYTAIDLTTYEATQFAAIQQWRQRPVPWVSELLGHLLVVLKGVLRVLLPAPVLEKIGRACESATENWQQDWQELQAIAQVEDYTGLRQATLEKCDQLAHHVRDRALLIATSEGGVTGLFDIFGEVADDGLTLVLALQTIHDIGLCYGYAPQTPQEKAFAWAIFKAGIAQTQAERRKALSTLYDMHQVLNPSRLQQEALQESLEDDADTILVGSTVEEGLSQLTEETLAGIVPVLGIVLSVWADRSLIEQVSEAAQREFQLRWLSGNQKIHQTEQSIQAEAIASPEATHQTALAESPEPTLQFSDTLAKDINQTEGVDPDSGNVADSSAII